MSFIIITCSLFIIYKLPFTRDQCKAQVHQYAGPIFKKFSSQAEAEHFIEQHTDSKEKSKSKFTTLRKRYSNAISAKKKRMTYLLKNFSRFKPYEGSSQDKIKPITKKLKLIDLPISGLAKGQGEVNNPFCNHISTKLCNFFILIMFNMYLCRKHLQIILLMRMVT